MCTQPSLTLVQSCNSGYLLLRCYRRSVHCFHRHPRSSNRPPDDDYHPLQLRLLGLHHLLHPQYPYTVRPHPRNFHPLSLTLFMIQAGFLSHRCHSGRPDPRIHQPWHPPPRSRYNCCWPRQLDSVFHRIQHGASLRALRVDCYHPCYALPLGFGRESRVRHQRTKGCGGHRQIALFGRPQLRRHCLWILLRREFPCDSSGIVTD